MTDQREAEAIERMADQYARWKQNVPGVIPALLRGPFAASMENARLFMPLALTALLSPSSAPCPTCEGRGTLNPDGVALGIGCRTCNGTGTVTVPPLLKWADEPEPVCATCAEVAAATGWTVDEIGPCPNDPCGLRPSCDLAPDLPEGTP